MLHTSAVFPLASSWPKTLLVSNTAFKGKRDLSTEAARPNLPSLRKPQPVLPQEAPHAPPASARVTCPPPRPRLGATPPPLTPGRDRPARPGDSRAGSRVPHKLPTFPTAGTDPRACGRGRRSRRGAQVPSGRERCWAARRRAHVVVPRARGEGRPRSRAARGPGARGPSRLGHPPRRGRSRAGGSEQEGEEAGDRAAAEPLPSG